MEPTYFERMLRLIKRKSGTTVFLVVMVWANNLNINVFKPSKWDLAYDQAEYWVSLILVLTLIGFGCMNLYYFVEIYRLRDGDQRMEPGNVRTALNNTTPDFVMVYASVWLGLMGLIWLPGNMYYFYSLTLDDRTEFLVLSLFASSTLWTTYLTDLVCVHIVVANITTMTRFKEDNVPRPSMNPSPLHRSLPSPIFQYPNVVGDNLRQPGAVPETV